MGDTFDALRRLDERAPKAFRPGPVLQVDYTGIERRCRTRYRTMFNPPLIAAVREILADLRRRPDEVAFHHAPARWRPTTVAVMSAGEGEGRWPLAFLQLEDGLLLLGDLEAARAALQRRVDAQATADA